MKAHFLLVSLIGTLISAGATAQDLGISGSVHHLSNGIDLSYTKHLNKNWDFEPGLRIMINTFSINENKQNHSYYQNGYAMKFTEHFGLYLRLSRKLVAYKSFRLEAMANLLLTRHGLLQRTTDIPTLDSTGWHLTDDITYFEPAIAGELTVGLKMKVCLSERIAIVAGSGIGMCLMNYKHESVSMISGVKKRIIQLDGPFMNKDRGVFEVVGLNGLPMLFIGATYQIW